MDLEVADENDSESDTMEDESDDEDIDGENKSNEVVDINNKTGVSVEVVSSGKFYTKLCQAPFGKSLMEHYTDLKKRVSATEAFKSAIEHPKKMIENCFKELELEGRKVEVLPYPTTNDVAFLSNKLKSFDRNYDENIKSKSQLQKMELIEQFLNCEKHCQIPPWTLEYRLCGELGCEICNGIVREVRAPDITIGQKNVRQEILSWLVLPVPNDNDDGHYLSAYEAKKQIEKQKMSFSDLKTFIPSGQKSSEEEKALKKAKTADKNNTYHATKVRETVKCDSCGVPRCVYSLKQVGATGGPTKKALEALKLHLDQGNICGNNIQSDLFYVKTAIRCGEPVESHYYNPKNGATKGGRIKTTDICALCCSSDNVVAPEQTKNERNDLGGRIPLPTCRFCMDLNVNIPCSAGRRTNQFEKNKQKRKEKKMN